MALTILCASPVSAVAPAQEAAKARIVVNVGTFRNRNGTLGCRLYSSAVGFPAGSARAVEKRVPIQGEVTQCAFEGVAAGTYAVSVMHDENNNHKLDKNFFGVPTEGYGVSNNHTHALSSPTWDESKFVIESGKDLALEIDLRY